MISGIWRLYLLGGLRAERGSVRIERFRTQKTAALLAFLAINPGRSHGREELVERFWPDDDFEAGRASLRVALTALRHALEPAPDAPGSVLVTTRTHVRLNPDAFWVDTIAFEAAINRGDPDAARRLYTGPFLPGVYDDWVLAERDRLDILFDRLAPSSAALSPAPPVSAPVAAPAPTPFPSSLPLTLTRYFGREEESARLLALLADPGVRLVTLLGPGGIGKTRLAIEACSALRDDKLRHSVPGGVWFVPLADRRDASSIPDALADALGVERVSGADPLAAIAAWIGGRRTVVILDNLEQFGAGVAPVIRQLLARVPAVTWLCTSRRRLAIAGERLISLSPLPLPDPDQAPAVLAREAAVGLFVDRARAARPEFGLTSRNAPEIAALCAALDGIPLAIELAASWAGVLTVAQMRERMSEPLSVSGRRADRADRHQSLENAIRWSFELLGPSAKRLFGALSVFRGGATVEALEAVGGLGDETLSVVETLVQHSMATADVSGAAVRYSQWESLRAFAVAHTAPHDRSANAQRHGAFFLDLAGRDEIASTRTDSRSVLARFDIEQANFRAALTAFAADLSQKSANRGLRLVGAMYRYWEVRGHFVEGMESAERALAHPRAVADATADDTFADARSQALNTAGIMALRLRRFDDAERFHTECLALRERLGDLNGRATSLHNLGIVWSALGEWERANVALREAVELQRQTDDPSREARSLTVLGNLAVHAGDAGLAESYLEPARALLEKSGDRVSLAYTLISLGTVSWVRGDPNTEIGWYERALIVCREIGDTMNAATAMRNIADTLFENQREPERATRLYAADIALKRMMGLDPGRDKVEENVATLRAILGDEEFGRRWSEGETADWRTMG